MENTEYKKCIKCGSIETCRWHCGPVCNKCYTKAKTGQTNYKPSKRYAPTIDTHRGHKDRDLIDPVGKVCIKCKIYKSYSEFSKSSRVIDGHAGSCKVCKKPEVSKYELNKEKCKQQSSEYYKTHKEQRHTWYKNKEKEDVNFKLGNRLRHRLRSTLKKLKTRGSHINNLGCSIEELKQHLESKFLPGMSWGNWTLNGWHIDHIIPLSSFDLTDLEQLKKACHYTNLQPLWAKDNISKGNKIISE